MPKKRLNAEQTRALAKMENWHYTNSVEELAKAVTPFFCHVPDDQLASSLQRYRDAGL